MHFSPLSFLLHLSGGHSSSSSHHEPRFFLPLLAVLHDLAVVDVDSVEQARALEARFPVLLSAPRESTRKVSEC